MPTTRYTHAVVNRIPLSLRTRLPTLDYDRAKRQHENYVQALRDIGLDVIEMPADENTPWCAFVDDTAFVCNGTAIITKPAEPERVKEVSLLLCPKYINWTFHSLSLRFTSTNTIQLCSAIQCY